MGRALKSD